MDDQLLAVPFNAETLEVQGTPTPVLSGLDVGFRSGASYDVSQNGTLVYVSKTRSRLVWGDRDGVMRPTPAPARDYGHPALSPDGRFVAVTLEEGSSRNVWVSDLHRGTLTRLTSGGDDTFSLWTPDGKRVVYTSGSTGGYNLFWTASDGSGKPEALTTGPRWHKPTSWSPDGRRLLVNVGEGHSTSIGVYELAMDAERALSPLLSDEFRHENAVYSAGGHWIAYQSNESGRMEVYVQSYPGLEERQQVSVNGGSNAIWHSSGRELMFAAGNRLMVTSISDEPELRVGLPKLFFEMSRYAGYAGTGGRNYDLSPDGETLLFVKSEQSTELHVVLNWFEELKRLVPVDNES